MFDGVHEGNFGASLTIRVLCVIISRLLVFGGKCWTVLLYVGMSVG